MAHKCLPRTAVTHPTRRSSNTRVVRAPHTTAQRRPRPSRATLQALAVPRERKALDQHCLVARLVGLPATKWAVGSSEVRVVRFSVQLG